MSSVLYYVELNGFAFAILAVILSSMHRHGSRHSLNHKLFLAIIANVMLVLVLGTITRILSGVPGALAKAASMFAVVLYNILNPAVCAIWVCYVDYYINESKTRLRRLFLLMSIPVAINAALSVASIFFNIYFRYDDGNVYHGGRFVFILLGICSILVLYTSVFLIRNRKKVANRSAYLHLLLFGLFPMAGGFLQISIPGLDVVWIAASVSILMIFINIKRDQLHTDYLTNLYNRRCLDMYLKSTLQNERDGLISGIMIDIDDFKAINDLRGHDNGDLALKTVARILKRTFRKTDFVARYGGDEFLVMLRVASKLELEALVKRLQNNLAMHNAQRTTPYEIRLSMGYACYDEACDASMHLFLKRLDALMYSDKQRHA